MNIIKTDDITDAQVAWANEHGMTQEILDKLRDTFGMHPHYILSKQIRLQQILEPDESHPAKEPK